MQDQNIDKIQLENHLERLKQNILKTDKERFLSTTRLMKTGIMLKKSNINHKTSPTKK